MPDYSPLDIVPEPIATPTEFTLVAVGAATRTSQAITMAQIRDVFDAGFGALAKEGPIGPGYAVYTGDPMGVFDLEIGFPVDGPATATTPVGRALGLTHLGGFNGLGASWELLTSALESVPGDRSTASNIVEVYVTDPSRTAEADLRTDLFVLLD